LVRSLRRAAAQDQAGFNHSYTNDNRGQPARLHEEQAASASVVGIQHVTLHVAGPCAARTAPVFDITAGASHRIDAGSERTRLAGDGRRRHDPASTSAADGVLAR